MPTYFPEEVFRNIASFLVDPYKADREKHASVWQTIRVKRERVTIIRGDDEYDSELITTEDEYFVYTTDDRLCSPDASMPFRFEPDDHLLDYDNLHEYTEFYIDGELDTDEDEWHNYEFEQYE